MSESRKIPNGWANVRLSNVCDKITDGSHFSPKSVDIGFPYVTVKDLKNDTIDFSKCLKITKKDYNNLSKNDCNPLRNDVLFSKDGTVGKVALINYDLRFVVLSSLAILRPHPKIILSEYLFYILKSSQFLLQALNQKKGVAIRRIILRDLKEINLNLPPIPEQDRIVAKIEELFSSLDKGIESLKTAQQQLKVYRQAVLKWAFEGKLISFNDLTNKPLCQIAKVKGGKRLPMGQIVQDNKTKYPYIRVVDFKDYSVNLSSLKYITEAAQKKITKYVIRKDEVFISIAGTIGRVGMIPEKLHGANLTENAAKIAEIKEIIPAYLMYYLSSPEIQEEISTLKKATSQPKLALYRIEKIGVKYPQSIDIQNKVIQEIESRLSVCDKMEESIEQSLKQSETLRQSILKKAFEGKLAPQDPNDEPASVLLARIKAEREQNKPETPRRQAREIKTKKAKS